MPNSWQGIYHLKPYPIYDAAKRFTKDMYIKDSSNKTIDSSFLIVYYNHLQVIYQCQ